MKSQEANLREENHALRIELDNCKKRLRDLQKDFDDLQKSTEVCLI